MASQLLPAPMEADGLTPPSLPPPAAEVAYASSRNSGGQVSSSAMLNNVPSLADAQAEDEEENKMEELTNALDLLNEFENFLLDLGLEDGHQS